MYMYIIIYVCIIIYIIIYHYLYIYIYSVCCAHCAHIFLIWSRAYSRGILSGFHGILDESWSWWDQATFRVFCFFMLNVTCESIILTCWTHEIQFSGLKSMICSFDASARSLILPDEKMALDVPGRPAELKDDQGISVFFGWFPTMEVPQNSWFILDESMKTSLKWMIWG